MSESFKLTYATMFNPPEELHMRFDEALATGESQPWERTWHADWREGPHYW